MAETSRYRVGELTRGIFSILLSKPDGMKAKDVLKQMEATVPPTPWEASTYPNNPTVRRYEKILRFCTIGPVKAGWLLKDKGTWTVTEAGREAFNRFKDPERFFAESDRLYRQWNEQREPPNSDTLVEGDTEGERAAATIEEAEESAWTEIEGYLTTMNPYDFQKLVAGLLLGMGYHVAWIAPPGPDGGVDVIAQIDPLGISGPRIKVQVKRSGRMSVREVRSFLAVVSDGDVGLFVSTGGFTKDAEDETRAQEKRRTMLVDINRLMDLWVQHYDRIPEDYRRLLPIRPVWFLALPQ